MKLKIQTYNFVMQIIKIKLNFHIECNTRIGKQVPTGFKKQLLLIIMDDGWQLMDNSILAKTNGNSTKTCLLLIMKFHF